MKIYFQSKHIQRIFNSEKKLIQKYGRENARKIMQRLNELRAADNMEMITYLPHVRCHQLKGRRKGQFAVALKHPFRLIFKPLNEPAPLKDDGGIDLKLVKEIIILGVVDYHG